MASDQSNTVSDFGKVALPIFVVSMIAENWYLKQQPQRTFGDLDAFSPTELSSNMLPGDPLVPVGYEKQDTQASLSALVGSVAAGLTTLVVTHKLDTWLYRHRIFNLGKRKGAFIGAMVAWDFLYYWEHRWMHEKRIFWAHHVTHHSSQYYNLSTALRQTSTSFLFSWIFYAPLFVIGFPIEVMLVVNAGNLIYQFWVHTQVVRRMGILDYILVTPSNHRVHHAQNERYIDKNYGGVLILWDRLFGTFEDERADEPVIFGVRKPLENWNPFWANLQIYNYLLFDAMHTAKWKDKLGIWFRRTGWRPADVAARFPKARADLASFTKYDPPTSTASRRYVLAQFIVVLLESLWVADRFASHGASAVLLPCLLLWAHLYTIGLMSDGRPGANLLEALRLVLVVPLVVSQIVDYRQDVLVTVMMAYVVVSLGGLLFIYISVNDEKTTV